MKRIIVFTILLCSALGMRAQYNVDRLLMSGRVALHYEDYVLSIQYFNQAISQKPYLWEPWQLRAIAKYYLEDWNGSETDATKAIELNPYITELYDLRGIALIRQDKYTEAIKDYSKAITLDPDNQGYWYNRAACYMEKKEYDTAQVQLDSIIKRWSKFSSPYLMKAQAYLHQKDTVTAAKWIDKSLEIDQYNADAWRVRANIALYKQQWKEADGFFSKALHLKPKDPGSYVNRALARLKLHNLRGAMSDYNTAIEQQPSNFLAHYNRGLLRQQVGDDNRAIEDFDYVINLEPNNIMAIFNRATLLDRVGDLRGAIRDYTKVINKFPNFWTGLKYRADCYRRLGQIANAEKDEFRILKAQMDKHIGIQNRWSRQKLNAMRKLSDIDPEKYNQIVVEDETDDQHDYKSEYRGKVQNHKVSEQFQPYIALTIDSKHPGLSSYTPFDSSVESYLNDIYAFVHSADLVMPKLGCVGEGTGSNTFSIADQISDSIRATRDTKRASMMLLYRSIAYSTAQNYEDALKDINTYLELNPASIPALWQKAICSAMLAEYNNTASTPKETDMRNAGVRSDFNKLLEQTKDNALVYYSLGTFYARMGDNKQAMEFFDKSLKCDNQLPYAYYNRGILYLHNGDIVKARQDFSKAGEMGIYNAYSLMKSKK